VDAAEFLVDGRLPGLNFGKTLLLAWSAQI
jgi:hypothetical protein